MLALPLCAVISDHLLKRTGEKKDNSRSRNRRDRIAPRRRIRIGQVATVGRAAHDEVVRHLEADVLHADGVVAVGALRGVGHVGIWVWGGRVSG